MKNYHIANNHNGQFRLISLNQDLSYQIAKVSKRIYRINIFYYDSTHFNKKKLGFAMLQYLNHDLGYKLSQFTIFSVKHVSSRIILKNVHDVLTISHLNLDKIVHSHGNSFKKSKANTDALVKKYSHEFPKTRIYNQTAECFCMKSHVKNDWFYRFVVHNRFDTNINWTVSLYRRDNHGNTVACLARIKLTNQLHTTNHNGAKWTISKTIWDLSNIKAIIKLSSYVRRDLYSILGYPLTKFLSSTANNVGFTYDNNKNKKPFNSVSDTQKTYTPSDDINLLINAVKKAYSKPKHKTPANLAQILINLAFVHHDIVELYNGSFINQYLNINDEILNLVNEGQTNDDVSVVKNGMLKRTIESLKYFSNLVSVANA